MLAGTKALEMLLDQQDEFVALRLQGVTDIDHCCSPFADRALASLLSNRITCTVGKSEPALVFDRNRLSALNVNCVIKHENLLIPELMASDMTMVGTKNRVHSMDDNQISCHQKCLPPPMPFVRNAPDRAISFVASSPTRREHNFRVGLSMHAERLKLCKLQVTHIDLESQDSSP